MAPEIVTKKQESAPKSWKKINEERKAFKKQRRQAKILREIEQQSQEEQLLAKPAESHTKREQPSTVSIAVPGSILENAQSAELRSYVAGQVARAASIFRVNEVIVFDDVGVTTARETKKRLDNLNNDNGEATGTVRSSSLQLARILQYLECPQYLRKFFFPLHKDLQYSGLLNPLDSPHHLRQQNTFRYREGIITERKAKEGCSFVNVGLLQDVLVDKSITPGVRVTVKLDNTSVPAKKMRGIVVSPDEPRRDTGVYWGYTVRIAHSLSEIFTKCPYEKGYDLTVGTSDRGEHINNVLSKTLAYKHLLIVFGGVKGLEEALANDDKLQIEDPALLFDRYLNVLPRQGSRTIRTEEAVLITMAALQDKLLPSVPDMETNLEKLLPCSADTGIKTMESNKNLKRAKDCSDTEKSSTKRKKEKAVPVLVHSDTERSEVGADTNGILPTSTTKVSKEDDLSRFD